MGKTGLMSKPPLYPSWQTPEDIIGAGNMKMFVEFLIICHSSTNNGEFPHKRLDKEIGAENRPAIAAVLDELRRNGYYPLGVDDRGQVKWGVVEKSDVQVLFESGLAELEGKTIPELQDMARKGYVKIVKDAAVQPAEDYEINYQEELVTYAAR